LESIEAYLSNNFENRFHFLFANGNDHIP